MESKKIVLNKELVELKHHVLQQRIRELLNKLKLINKIIECPKDIKSMEIISASYEKMYQAILQSEEYDKYHEVENTIIPQISEIESNLDKYIYKLAKQYSEQLDSIENSENYKNFNNLEGEIPKINSLRDMLKFCVVYHSQEQQNELKDMIYMLKFKTLMRKQLQQIVYQNGGNKSWLTQYDNEEEKEYFKKCLEGAWNSIGEDELLDKYNYDLETIMSDFIILNHLIFKLALKEINANPEKYIVLLDAPIFNPHMCNIGDDPYSEKIAYAPKGDLNGLVYGFYSRIYENDYDQESDYLMRNKINLSLLVAIFKNNIIKNENTTIAECSNIFRRFGFECRPVTISEGQEIVSRIFDKVKHTIKPKAKDLSLSKGKYCKIAFTGYNYEFKKVEMPFHTTAEIRDDLQTRDNTFRIRDLEKRREDKYLAAKSKTELRLGDMNVILDMKREVVGFLKTDYWMFPLEEYSFFKLRETCIPRHFSNEGEPNSYYITTFFGSKLYGCIDYDALYDSYKSDLTDLRIRTKRIKKSEIASSFTIAINLDDIAELPIDYEKIEILTEKEVGEER